MTEERDTFPAPRVQRLQWFTDGHGSFAVIGPGKKSILRWYTKNWVDGARQVWFGDDCLGCADTYIEAEALLSLWANEVLLELGDL